MDIREKYSLELQKIHSDLEILKNRKIYEIDATPGTVSCAEIGKRLEKNIAVLLSKIERDEKSDLEKFGDMVRNLD